MICVSICNRDFEQIARMIDSPEMEMAEIRLDLCRLDKEEIEELFANSDIPLIATCRAASFEGNDWEKASDLLETAIVAGANYADLEIEAPFAISKKIQTLCQENGTVLIRSYHNSGSTPPADYLEQVMQRCFRYGGGIAKIVTVATSPKDNETVFSLYEKAPGQVVAFCMGDEGRQGRIDCIKAGAPFTYAAPDEGDAVVPSQLPFSRVHSAVYGEFKGFDSEIQSLPASKSFAQRAIIAAALAAGTSRLHRYSPCDDSEAAIAVAQALGARVSRQGSTLVIEGTGSCPATMDRIDVGESGLLARLMIPLVSCIGGRETVIEGRGTLLRRPLSGAADIMAAFGVLLENIGESAQAQHIPLKVKGKLIPGTADIPGQHGSQLISGLLMSLPLCDGDSTVYVSDPKSLPYMFITCDVLKRFGIRISSEMEGDAPMVEYGDWSACSSVNFKVKGGQRYKAAEFDLEADWSAAANFMVAGAIFGGVTLSGLDTSSLQADLSIVDILVDAGACISELESGEICVRKGPLRAFEADLNNAPDLFPIVSILAAFCQGDTIISGVKRLIGKESDRGKAIAEMLGKMGVGCCFNGDSIIVSGESLASRLINGRLLKGGFYNSHHDHRLAMALEVASIGTESPIVIDDRACVGKSFPGFFEIISRS